MVFENSIPVGFFNPLSKNSKIVQTYGHLRMFLPKYVEYYYFINDYKNIYAVLFPDNEDTKKLFSESDFERLSKLPKNIDTYTKDEIKSFDDLHKLTKPYYLKDLVVDPLNQMKQLRKPEKETKTASELFFEDVQKLLKEPGMMSRLKKKFTTGTEKETVAVAEGAGTTNAGTQGTTYSLGGRKSRRRNKTKRRRNGKRRRTTRR